MTSEYPANGAAIQQSSSPSGRRVFVKIASVLLGAQLVVLALAVGAVWLMDAAHVYTAGEVLYSNNRKAAVHALYQYAHSGDRAHYSRYRRFISTPASHDETNRALLEESPNAEATRTAFPQGDSDPDGMPAMMRVLLRAHDTPILAQPLDIRRRGEQWIARLDELAESLHTAIRTRSLDSAQRRRIVAEINAIDATLARLDSLFSHALREVSRSFRNATLIGLGTSTLLLCGLGLTFGWRLQRRREAADSDLARREVRLRQLLHGLTQAVVTVDGDLRIDVANRATWELFGLEREDLHGRLLADLFAEHHKSDLQAYLAHVANSGSAEQSGRELVLDARHACRGDFPVEISVARQQMDEGCRLIMTLRDVSARHQRELLDCAQMEVLSLMSRGNVRLHDIVHKMVEVIERVCPDTRAAALYANEGRLWHWVAPSMPPSYRELIDGLEIGPATGSSGAAAFRGAAVLVSDIRTDPVWAHYHDSADQLDFRACWAFPVLGQDRRVVATLSVYAREPRMPDGLELRLAEGMAHLLTIAFESRRYTERFLLTFNNSPNALILVDNNGRVVLTNTLAQRWFGYDAEEFQRLRLTHLVPPDLRDEIKGHRPGHMHGAQTRGTGEGMGLVAVRKDGSEFPVEVELAPIRSAGEAYVLATVVDISERLEARRLLNRKTRELERSNEELDRFAYIASHDLRAPIRGIGQIAEWLAEDLGDEASPAISEHLRLLRSRIVRMKTLLEDLLSYARAGNLEYEFATVDTAEMVRSMFVLMAPPEGWTLELEGEFPVLTTLKTPLEEIIRNLIGNAVKHHDRQEGRIVVSIETSDGGNVFHVSDDGPGIPEGQRARVFQMFQTLKPRDEVEGSGMGLALVKKILDVYGGTVAVASNSMGGTTVRFTWPHEAVLREQIGA